MLRAAEMKSLTGPSADVSQLDWSTKSTDANERTRHISRKACWDRNCISCGQPSYMRAKSRAPKVRKFMVEEGKKEYHVCYTLDEQKEMVYMY